MANNKTTSIKGDIVDFDLMKIKTNMENREKPESVQLREQYIDIRRRRNPRRNVSDLENEQRANANDARAKIAQSKANKMAAMEVSEDVDEKPITVNDIVDGNVSTPSVQTEEPEPTPPARHKSSKKIVKK